MIVKNKLVYTVLAMLLPACSGLTFDISSLLGTVSLEALEEKLSFTDVKVSGDINSTNNRIL